MIAVFAILKIYPFGDDTIMTGDTTYQLVDYLSYYKTVIFGNNDFSYSMSKNMGGEMAGFAAYYLYSPLNLLTLFFPREYLFAGIGLIIVIVPGLASLSMCYALEHLNKDKEGTLIFSLCYGLSAYIVVYNELLYYYTNVILLPLIFLSLRKLINDKKYINIPYIMLLAYAVINNYYTGYMICLFLLIYMVYYLASVYEGKDRFGIFLRFSADSLIAAGLSCFTLIPAVLSLSGEKNNFSLGLYLSFSPFAYFSKLYSGSFAGDFGAGMPNIYCGIIVSIILVLILANNKLSARFRIGTGIMLVFFWMDFCINTMNVAWHGFNQPIGFPYRQAFIVILFCIVTAYEFSDFTMIPKKASAAAMAGIFCIYTIYGLIRRIETMSPMSVVITSMIAAALMFVFMFPTKQRMLFLCLITIADLVFNTGYSLSHFYFTTVEEYQEPLSLIGEGVDQIKKQGDDDLYRVEKLFRRTNNDAMMFDFAGLTHFSSSEKKSTMKFMGDLGFRNNGNWAMYTGENTALADSLLSVRYIMSQFDATGKPYDLIFSDDEKDLYVYENKHAMPMVMAADSSIYDVEFSDDPFENQNMIADAVSGEEQDILHIQKAVRRDNEDGSVSFDVKIDNEGELYCFFSAPDIQDAVLFVNDEEWTDYFQTYNWATLNMHERVPGETVHFDIRPKTEEKIIVDDGCFAVIDNDNFIRWSDSVKKDETILKKESSSCLKGMYDTDKNNILFSLPMDRGWHLYIDGKEYQLKEACGHLTGAEVPEGRHEIIMRFIPPGRYAGIIISMITFILLFIYCVLVMIKQQYIEKIKKIENI